MEAFDVTNMSAGLAFSYSVKHSQIFVHIVPDLIHDAIVWVAGGKRSCLIFGRSLFQVKVPNMGILTENFRSLPRTLQENLNIVSQNRSRTIPLASFLIQYFLSIQF
jgi:hypothetical protein